MLNHIKKQTEDIFHEHIEQIIPEAKEHIKRRIGVMLADQSNKMLQEGIHSFSDMNRHTIAELELHRKLFRQHIELIEKYTKLIVESFKRQGFISYDTDPKTKRPIVKARTALTTELVQFLNKLDDSVYEFYKNVYKIETPEQKLESGFQQISLF
jgi:hypothetical protein